jgi:hypothetical protein
MEEIWKDIVGFENEYKVSNMGNVYSLRLNKLMNKNISNRGYERVTINKKNISVHRLVCIAFLGLNENKKFVNHINGIKHDNRLDNLEWVTPRENSIHYLSSKQIKEIKLKTCVRYERWISINGKNRRIGRFKTIEEANKAYFDKLEEISIYYS